MRTRWPATGRVRAGSTRPADVVRNVHWGVGVQPNQENLMHEQVNGMNASMSDNAHAGDRGQDRDELEGKGHGHGHGYGRGKDRGKGDDLPVRVKPDPDPTVGGK